jgi:hypothetical protein
MTTRDYANLADAALSEAASDVPKARAPIEVLKFRRSDFRFFFAGGELRCSVSLLMSTGEVRAAELAVDPVLPAAEQKAIQQAFKRLHLAAADTLG